MEVIGVVDKTKFRVMVAMAFLSEPEEQHSDQDLLGQYNRGISEAIGKGHSLSSCIL